MNQRIKELALQARIKDHWSIDEARYLTNFLDEQKFAELIVRECAGIANKQFSAASGLDDRDCWTAAEMTKHFGVEP